MKHPRLEQWESQLKKVLDDLDDHLEDRYGSRYELHPARPERGRTSAKAHDGLFNIVASFTLGGGSEIGKGYVVDVHMATLEKVPRAVEKEIETAAITHLREQLPRYFPGKNLRVDLDGRVIKIYGDLSLGSVT